MTLKSAFVAVWTVIRFILVSIPKGIWANGGAFFRFLMGVAWLFPIVAILLGMIDPGLRQNVSMKGLTDPYIFLPFFTSTLVCGLWFYIEYRYAANYTTPIEALRADTFRSITMGFLLVALCIVAGYEGQLMWALIPPTVFAVGDAYSTADQSIGTAAAKPLIQQSRGSA